MKVALTRRAERDVREIRDWIAERSLTGARSWVASFERVLQRIAKDASSFPQAEEAQALGEDVREALFKTRRGRVFRAMFVIRTDRAYVVCVRSSDRAPVTPNDIQLP
jgi:plasmid stabilization system protein ParE